MLTNTLDIADTVHSVEQRTLLVGPPVDGERADAARNRQRILEVASEILAAEGVDALTMDGVALAAGVGKGTIFRRFGSRAGLLAALLNDNETDFQRRYLEGPAPLGPGANPVDRLVAYGRGRMDILQMQGDLLRALEQSTSDGYASPARAAAHLHVVVLLRAAGVTGDLPVLAFTLLATLDATLVLHENRSQNIEMSRLADGWEDLVRRVTAASDG